MAHVHTVVLCTEVLVKPFQYTEHCSLIVGEKRVPLVNAIRGACVLHAHTLRAELLTFAHSQSAARSTLCCSCVICALVQGEIADQSSLQTILLCGHDERLHGESAHVEVHQ